MYKYNDEIYNIYAVTLKRAARAYATRSGAAYNIIEILNNEFDDLIAAAWIEAAERAVNDFNCYTYELIYKACYNSIQREQRRRQRYKMCVPFDDVGDIPYCIESNDDVSIYETIKTICAGDTLTEQIIFYRIYGYSIVDIAKELHISRPTVYARLNNIKKRFKDNI